MGRMVSQGFSFHFPKCELEQLFMGLAFLYIFVSCSCLLIIFYHLSPNFYEFLSILWILVIYIKTMFFCFFSCLLTLLTVFVGHIIYHYIYAIFHLFLPDFESWLTYSLFELWGWRRRYRLFCVKCALWCSHTELPASTFSGMCPCR